MYGFAEASAFNYAPCGPLVISVVAAFINDNGVTITLTSSQVYIVDSDIVLDFSTYDFGMSTVP